jgi:hypothetical protein
MWLICLTPSVICLPYYLKFLTLFVVFVDGWFGYEMAGFALSDNLFSVRLYGASSFTGSMWFIPLIWFFLDFVRHLILNKIWRFGSRLCFPFQPRTPVLVDPLAWCKWSTMLDASLPEDGSRDGFWNIILC